MTDLKTEKIQHYQELNDMQVCNDTLNIFFYFSYTVFSQKTKSFMNMWRKININMMPKLGSSIMNMVGKRARKPRRGWHFEIWGTYIYINLRTEWICLKGGYGRAKPQTETGLAIGTRSLQGVQYYNSWKIRAKNRNSVSDWQLNEIEKRNILV